MRSCDLCIVIHNHQPVGNFDHVIEDAYQHAYLPFLDLLERRGEVRIALHNSGCLWEWLERSHRDYGERIEALVRRGQIELMGGGFYEPILPLLPSRDRRGQIARMKRFLSERFGVTPRGLWLAERVWESHLALDLAQEGIDYVCLDDSQFQQAGLRDEDLCGYYLTEDSGKSIAVYPIHMHLRYQIPFATPETVLETLRASADERPGTMRLFGDDGEKFGVWPGTHRLCYEERWLDRFFDLLKAESQTVRLVLPSEHRREHPPLGRVYLPDGSYREMGEWALPPDARNLFDDTSRFLREHGREDADLRLLRGGFFRNFLVHYPESNQMHKRTLLAHDALDAAESLSPEATNEIRDHFWRAQCNCAYWHGVFGGLYLPHLRDGIYRQVLAGERLLDHLLRGEAEWVDARLIDYNHDGDEEVILSSDSLTLFLSPLRGGGLIELDDRTLARNLINSMTRRREAYHARIGTEVKADDSVNTIHAEARSKEEHLERFLHFDRIERVGLVDRFFDQFPAPEELNDRCEIERGDFAGSAYRLIDLQASDPAQARFQRDGHLRGDPGQHLELTKTVALRAGSKSFDVDVCLRSRADQQIAACYGLETVFNLLAGEASDRYLLVDGFKPERANLASYGSHPQASRFCLVDAWDGVRITLVAEPTACWIHAPVYSVSSSEAGAERIYQGTVVMPAWEVRLEPDTRFVISLRVVLSHGPETEGMDAP